MRRQDGRGYLLFTGGDVPYAGWGGARLLDAAFPVATAPWEGLAVLAELAGLLPRGFGLLWDAPAEWVAGLPPEIRAGYWKLLTHLPGLTVHLRGDGLAGFLREPARIRWHGSHPPTGELGHAWRQGWIGWVPGDESAWSLPDQGLAEDGDPAGWLWGELVLPLGALEHLEPADLANVLAEAQARCEKAISLRMGAGAWPGAFPFQRRRTGWRVSFLGGREWQLSGVAWERAAARVQALLDHLGLALRCPIHPGVCTDPEAAAALGQQAMAEGLPWRAALPLPPAYPSFTPGLGADPRDPASLEARCGFPRPLADLLAVPAVRLRVPAVPLEGAVAAFVAGLQNPPAIRWSPPDAQPPGPFLPERPWAEAAAFPPLLDTTQVLQPSLFDDLD